MSLQENEKQPKENQSELEAKIDIVDVVYKCFRVFRRMWLSVVILTIVGAAIFGIRAKMNYTELYRAYVVMTVSRQWELEQGEEAGYYDFMTAEQTASIFPHILTSEVLRNKVADDIGVEAIYGSISVDVTPDTNMLTISVTDRDAQRAYDTLQSLIKNYPSIAEGIIGKTSSNILDDSGVPTTPSNALEIRQSVLRGAGIGALLGAAYIFGVTVMNRAICKEADIRKYMNTHCLGSIPNIVQKKRSRKSEEQNLVITNPKLDESMQEALRVIRNKVEYHAQKDGKKVFLITSALAGEGKSTFAVNLALSLAINGRKVSLIDADLRHPSDRKILQLEDGPGLGEILKGEAKLRNCLTKVSCGEADANMKFLFLPGGEPIEDGSELLAEPALKTAIDVMKDWGDYVIVDSAPVGLLTDAAVLAANTDGAIYVVRKDYASVNLIMDGMELLAESKVPVIGGILNGI